MAIKLLFADDSITMQKVIQLTLENEDIDLDIANNGEEALEAVRTDKPDIVVADISMPEMDGFELCRQIKSTPETGDIPVVLISGELEKYDSYKGEAVGADGHITKPFKSKEFLSVIRKFVGRKVMEPEPLPEGYPATMEQKRVGVESPLPPDQNKILILQPSQSVERPIPGTDESDEEIEVVEDSVEMDDDDEMVDVEEDVLLTEPLESVDKLADEISEKDSISISADKRKYDFTGEDPLGTNPLAGRLDGAQTAPLADVPGETEEKEPLREKLKEKRVDAGMSDKVFPPEPRESFEELLHETGPEPGKRAEPSKKEEIEKEKEEVSEFEETPSEAENLLEGTEKVAEGRAEGGEETPAQPEEAGVSADTADFDALWTEVAKELEEEEKLEEAPTLPVKVPFEEPESSDEDLDLENLLSALKEDEKGKTVETALEAVSPGVPEPPEEAKVLSGEKEPESGALAIKESEKAATVFRDSIEKSLKEFIEKEGKDVFKETISNLIDRNVKFIVEKQVKQTVKEEMARLVEQSFKSAMPELRGMVEKITTQITPKIAEQMIRSAIEQIKKEA